jgi:tetratricopeptide (TPR) repeat protein
LNKALKLDPDNPGYWITVAETEYKLGNIISSIDAWEEACVLDPSNMEIWLKWSQIYYEQGDFEKAIEIILKGIDELPETSELYYRATAYLIAAGKYKQAFNYLENALILNFENHTVLLEFFPKLQTQKALFKIIDQYRKENF